MKDIPGFEGRYAVTKDGRVWSYPKSRIHHLSGKTYLRYKGSWLKPDNARDGYLYFRLRDKNHKMQKLSGHRIVALTYLTNEAMLPCINHVNAKKTDNRVSNLEWCTHKHNSEHMVLMGRVSRGESHKKSKLHDGDIREIRTLVRAGVPFKEVANRYGVYFSTIYKINHGETWKHIN